MHSRSRRQFLKDGYSLAGTAILGASVLSRTTQDSAGHERFAREETLADLPLSRMIELLKNKDTCPTEVITAHIDRIHALHAKINAVVYLDEQRALAAAKIADHKLIAGDVDFRREFLFGIPFSVKNTMSVEGVPTVCGVPAYRGKIAQEDAYYVKKYKDAGAIFLGATNLPFLSFGMESDNAVFGRTNNPHDLSRTAGGSSGGEAALIATGGSPMGIATDFGGSTRVPAHWNGLFALCPAAKGQSWKGFPGIPDEGQLDPPFARLGTMTRSVTDLDRVKDVFIDPSRAARLGVPELRDFRTLKPSEFRILFLTCWPSRKNEAAAEIRTAVRLAVEALERAGARTEEHEPTFLEQTVDIANSFAIRDITSAKVREMTDSLGGREDAALQRFIELIERVEGEYPAQRRAELMAAYPAWVEKFQHLMSDCDAIVLPVADMPAPEHGTTIERRISKGISSYNFVANLTNTCPSGTAPVLKTATGLPVGVGVVGAPFAEDKVLRILYELETVFGGALRPVI